MLFWTILMLFLRFVISHNADRELLLAAEKGDIKLMKEMLEKGAHVTTRNNNGIDALLWAANNGHVDAVQYLLDRGDFDINRQSNNGKTALMWAITWDHISVVKLLIKYKADIHRSDVSGMNALMHAVMGGNANIVEELIEHGADLLKKNKHNATALTIARNTGISHCLVIAQFIHSLTTNNILGNEELIALLEPHYPIDEYFTNPIIIFTYTLYCSLSINVQHFVYKVRELTGLLPSKIEEL